MHHRHLRLIVGVIGQLISAIAVNLFIVPLNLYSGGTVGVCQLIRTLLQTYVGLDFGTHDIAGMLYFLSNIPILVFAFLVLGRHLMVRTITCVVAFSLFTTIIPIPSTPIIKDYLTSCLLGGILNGVGCGIALTCGCSAGGLETLGLCLSKLRPGFSVGRLAMIFNTIFYAGCLVMFIPEVVIYSLIYNYFSSLVLDRVHQQNVNVQALIFTREDDSRLSKFIIENLGRGVTYWNGVGVYTGEGLHVLCVCLSKFEIEELLHMVHSIDPHAFLTIQEGIRIFGNFSRRVD